MTADELLPLPPGWRRAAPWLPAILRPGRVYVGPLGETVRVGRNGFVDLVELGGRPHGGAASDPALHGRARRYP